MDKQAIYHNHTLQQVFSGIILFVALAFFLSTIGHYNFCYMEHWQTFLYNATFVTHMLAQPGGCAQLIAHFLIQFFTAPLTGILVTALLLTLTFLLNAATIRRCTGSGTPAPLALFPVVALAFLHYNTNYLYAGTVAFLLMSACLYLQTGIRKFRARLAYSVASAWLLFAAAGPAAFLYSGLMVLVELFRNPRRTLWYLLPPLAVYLAGEACVRWGMAGELKAFLLPDGYFTLRLQPSSLIYLPWGTVLAAFAAAGLYKLSGLRHKLAQGMLAVLLVAGAVAFALTGAGKHVKENSEFFKELSYHTRLRQWDAVIGKCNHHRMSNLLYQNCLNMALAEKGILADYLFYEPCVDIQTIYVVPDKTPYVSALLSDVYFSMGHIAFAQRYAFEANQSMGNFSPRMLQRLVQASLVYGQYDIAQKYLRLLGQTLYYKDWAARHQRFLWNDAAVEADPLLGAKRKCIFPDNRFSGSRGLDDDLKHIILQNPSHSSTIQYLGSLYLLDKDIDRFKATLETFYGTEALPQVLPVAFQEGVIAFAPDGETLEKYHIQPSVIERYKTFIKQPARTSHNLWHFLRYTR